MGTSGAYGGSGSSDWGQARDAYAAAEGSGAGSGSSATSDSPITDSTITDSTSQDATPASQALVNAVARAMRRTSAFTPSTPGAYTAGRTSPGRRTSTGGYTRSRTSGSTGSGTNGLPRKAARGAAAIAGARAYRSGDANALAELGLSLPALRALPNDRARCSAIVEALLGAPAHPDDAALNAVATQTMMDVLSSPNDVPSEQLIETYMANLTYELALVELTSQQRADPLPAAEARKIEEQSKQFIVNTLSAAPAASQAGRLTAQGLIDKAAGLAAKVLRVFGRRS